MSEVRAETVCQGLAAARGLAIGRIVLHGARRPRGRVSGGPEQQRAALRAAIETAARELKALAAGADELARDILEFQTALLEDEDLIEPILAAVAAGQPADEAWSTALDREIAEYRAGEDEVFRARAADLADLRDRVQEALCPISKDNGDRTRSRDLCRGRSDAVPLSRDRLAPLPRRRASRRQPAWPRRSAGPSPRHAVDREPRRAVRSPARRGARGARRRGRPPDPGPRTRHRGRDHRAAAPERRASPPPTPICSINPR